MMFEFFDPRSRAWRKSQGLPTFNFICGFCGNRVASDRGYAIGMYADAGGDIVGGVWIVEGT